MINGFIIFILLLVSFTGIRAEVQSGDPEKASSSTKAAKSPSPKARKDKTLPKPNSPKQDISNSSRPTAAKPRNTKRASLGGRKNAAPAAIEVSVNESGSDVVVNSLRNGSEAGISSYRTTDANEMISFKPLEAGDYLIRVKKDGFSEEQKSLSIRAGETARIVAILKPIVGYLTINPNIPDAEIEVSGIGSFFGKTENIVLKPRTYRVSITRDGYETFVQNTEVKAGQKMTISPALEPIRLDKLLRSAENGFEASRYREAIANCRLILEQNPDDGRVNLLMGYAYFYSNRPRESRFYLARALALQNEVEFPLKIYKKESGSEILTGGKIKISQNSLSFTAADKTEPIFTVSPSSIVKLEINQDKNASKNPASPKPDFIEIKAVVAAGKKKENKTFWLFPRQAFTRASAPNRAEIAGCSGCGSADCACQPEIRAVYELLLNWKSGSYPRRLNDFSNVAAPASTFNRFEGQNFSLRIPENWQAVSQNDSSVWFAPVGGFTRVQNRINYSFAVNAGVRPINRNDLQAESESFYQQLLSGNSYLEPVGAPKEILISGRKGLVSSFAGFGIDTGAEEFIQIYTAFTPNGNLFYLTTVTPFEQRQNYKPAFHTILESIRF